MHAHSYFQVPFDEFSLLWFGLFSFDFHYLSAVRNRNLISDNIFSLAIVLS